MSDLEKRDIKQPEVFGLPKKRDKAVEILTRCYGENLLELEHFEDWVARVEQASDLKMLAEVLEQLPAELKDEIEQAVTLPAMTDEQSSSQRAPLEAKTIKSLTPITPKKRKQRQVTIMGESKLNHFEAKRLDTITLMGETRVNIPESALDLNRPLIIKSLNIMGSTIIDLSKITLTNKNEITIRVGNIMGEIIVTVPEGARLRNSVINIMGETRDKTGSETAQNGPIINIKGICIMGSVVIRDQLPAKKLKK